jgi:hypothetical protein
MLLALVGCPGQPCVYVCGTDSDCGSPAFYCEYHQCLRRCELWCGGCQNDTFHNCTACGVACADGQFCLSGICAASCGKQTNCQGSCFDLQTDRLNCGGCGHMCGIDQTCSAGACVSISSCE